MLFSAYWPEVDKAWAVLRRRWRRLPPDNEVDLLRSMVEKDIRELLLEIARLITASSAKG